MMKHFLMPLWRDTLKVPLGKIALFKIRLIFQMDIFYWYEPLISNDFYWPQAKDCQSQDILAFKYK